MFINIYTAPNKRLLYTLQDSDVSEFELLISRVNKRMYIIHIVSMPSITFEPPASL